MSARRTRYRAIRLAVLGAALVAGIGYPLVLALGGAALVDVHAGRHGPTISVHNPRPWLVVAAVAAIALLAEQAMLRARVAASPGAPPDAPGDGRSRAELTARLAEARREVDGLLAARRSEREWNAALDAHIAELWADMDSPAQAGGAGATQPRLAATLLELTMELAGARTGLLARVAGPEPSVLASAGVGDPVALAVRLGASSVQGLQQRVDETGAEWLLIGLSAEGGARGAMALGDRPGGFDGLDRDVLAAVAQRAAALLEAAGRPPG